MQDPLDAIGPALVHTGLVAGLLILTLGIYGVIVAMRRWWLVLAAALLMLSGILYAMVGEVLPPPAPDAPQWLRPDATGYVGLVLCYIALGVATRLATLRLEWRGWTRKWIGDIHIAAFVAPIAGAAAVSTLLQ